MVVILAAHVNEKFIKIKNTNLQLAMFSEANGGKTRAKLVNGFHESEQICAIKVRMVAHVLPHQQHSMNKTTSLNCQIFMSILGGRYWHIHVWPKVSLQTAKKMKMDQWLRFILACPKCRYFNVFLEN